MIRKLSLKHFGKFQDATFEFGALNVFIGPNEAGKTTLVDALFEGLSRPTRANKRHLVERYGKDRMFELHFTSFIRPDPIPEDLFLDLLTVHSGNVAIPFSNKSAWLSQIKATLFSGGLDISWFIRECEKGASEHGSRKHNLELNGIETRLAEVKEQIRLIHESQQAVQNTGSEIQRLGQMIEELIRAFAVKKQNYTDAKAQLEQEAAGREYERIRMHLQTAEQLRDVQNQLTNLHAFHTFDTATLESKDLRCRDSQAAYSRALERQEKAADTLKEFEKNHPAIPLPAWINIILPMVAGLMFLWAGAAVGVLRIVLPQNFPLSFAGTLALCVAGTLVCGLGCIVNFIRRQKILHMAKTRQTLLTQLNTSLHADHQAVSATRQQLDICERQLQEYCTAHQVQDSAAARMQYQRFLDLRLQEERYVRSLKSFADPKTLREQIQKWQDILSSPVAQNTPPPKMSDDALQRMATFVTNLEADLSKTSDKIQQLKQHEAAACAAQQSELKSFAPRLLALEEEAAALETQRRELLLQRAGSQMALDIFQEISRSQNWQLVDLRQEIEEHMQALYERPISTELRDFDESAMAVEDAGTQMRPLQYLSTATREFFLLTARLILAKRAKPGFKLLILDEPFAAFDPERTRRFIGLLKSLLLSHGWQVCLFSKDEELAQLCLATVQDTRVHYLSSLGRGPSQAMQGIVGIQNDAHRDLE